MIKNHEILFTEALKASWTVFFTLLACFNLIVARFWPQTHLQLDINASLYWQDCADSALNIQLAQAWKPCLQLKRHVSYQPQRSMRACRKAAMSTAPEKLFRGENVRIEVCNLTNTCYVQGPTQKIRLLYRSECRHFLLWYRGVHKGSKALDRLGLATEPLYAATCDLSTPVNTYDSTIIIESNFITTVRGLTKKKKCRVCAPAAFRKSSAGVHTNMCKILVLLIR